jgi:DNA polymerase-3 subunit epsilon
MANPLLALGPVLAVAALAGALVRRVRRRRRAGPDIPLHDLDFVAIDIETTGLDPKRDAIVALAAIPFRGGRPSTAAGYARLVNPGRPIPPDAQLVHGISDADVRDAPSVTAALPEFLERCRGGTLVAHSAGFDLAIINRAARAARLSPLSSPILDVGLLAHALFPSWWDLSLEGLGRLLDVEVLARHTAQGDALTAGKILVHMRPLLEQRGVRTLEAALRLQRRGALIPSGPGATGGGLAGP